MTTLLQTQGCPAEAAASDSLSDAAGVAAVLLAPGEPLVIDSTAQRFICVADGIVYVRGDEDEVALTPGDQLSLAAGEAVRAWNAGDFDARVIVGLAA
jgi:uncharacterized cupin superfamily protein